MNYLITGGCGFIGSNLARSLIAAGHSVVLLDDLSSGKIANSPSQAELLVADITTPDVFDSLLEKIDGCFHLAAIVSVQRSAEEWLRTHQVNLSGTVSLFDSIVRSKRKIPVVFASSAAVYGNNQELPLKESLRVLPLSAYGADKLACEFHAAVAANIHEIPTIGMRFFNVFGPFQEPTSPYSGVISIFTHRMKNNLPVTIFGDGRQTRDFIYVGDVVCGLIAAMNKLQSGKIKHAIFNLCTNKQTSINDLAEIIASITNSASKIIHAPARIGDIRDSLGDNSLSKEILEIQSNKDLSEGLRNTINWEN